MKKVTHTFGTEGPKHRTTAISFPWSNEE